MYLKTPFAQMYLKTRFAQRQSFLASPLLAWRLNFVEPDECGAYGVVVVAPSFITALLQHYFSNFFGASLSKIAVNI
jgi:hypothetical protein